MPQRLAESLRSCRAASSEGLLSQRQLSVLERSLSSINNIANHSARVGCLPALINRLPATPQLVSPAFSLSEFGVFSPIGVESTPTSPATAGPSSAKKRKVQFSESEKRARLSVAVMGVTPIVVSPLDESLFAERSNMERICENLRELDSLRDKGLIPQLFAIGKIIVEIIQQRIGSRKVRVIVEEIKKFSVSFRKSKVSEAKRFYKLGIKFPRLLGVITGFTAVELTQAARHIEAICEQDKDFWSCPWQ